MSAVLNGPRPDIGSFLGLPWNDFLEKWCQNIAPAETPDEVWQGLDALARLDPACYSRLGSGSASGPALIASAVTRGFVLLRCERIPGFAPVLKRIQDGERSAFVEALCAAAYQKVGCRVQFGVKVGTKVPDLKIEIGGVDVYAEVVAPEESHEVYERWRENMSIAGRLLRVAPGHEVEVYFPTEPSAAQVAATVFAARVAPCSDDIQSYSDGIQVSKRPSVVGGRALVEMTPRIPVPTDGSVFDSMNCDATGVPSSAYVRMRMTDSRAVRFVKAEAHHFSHGYVNVLIIDVTRVPGGDAAWRGPLQSAFKHNQHTRIGAIVTLAELRANPTQQVWYDFQAIANPYAAQVVPEAFLKAI